MLRVALSGVLLAATSACVTMPDAGADDRAAEAKRCAGAAALPNGCAPPESGEFTPTPDKAGRDYRGNGAKEGCWTDVNFKKFKSCTFGSKNAKYTVALVGNSHMAQYLKNFTDWTDDHDLRVVTFLLPQCFPNEARIDFSGRPDAKGLTERCYKWGQWAKKEVLELRPDVVVTSGRTYRKPVKPLPAGEQATWRKGYRDYLAAFVEKGLDVTVIRDNPVPEYNVPKCLKRNPTKYSKCAGDPQRWLLPDQMVQGAKSLNSKRVHIIDLTRYMCTDERCPAVLGGVSVYRDHSHLSGTWIETLKPYLEPPFMKVLKN